MSLNKLIKKSGNETWLYMKKITLDTNSYSEFFKGDKTILRELNTSSSIFIPVIVLGELFYGFHRGELFDLNEKRLNKFLKKDSVKIINISSKTARIFGEIKNLIWKKGNSIPSNDIWIAACAIETDSVLVTYDKHFLDIPNLKLWSRIK